MTEVICSIEDCGRQGKLTRTWCGMHYARFLRHGDPLHSERVPYATPEESLLARTEPLLWTGCLIWTGAANNKGYPQIAIEGRMVLAHRYAYERAHGPIPEGVLVDHQYHCSPLCVEASHLRLATRSQNMMNRAGLASHNTSGYRGVSRSRSGWLAKVGRVRGGVFRTPEAAAQKAAEMRAEMFGEFAGRGR